MPLPTQLVSLAQMRTTIRRMTGRYSPAQLTDTQIDNYFNLFYTLHFPAQFKNLKLTKPLVFNTVPNVDTYQFVYENGLTIIPQQNPDNDIPVPGNFTVNPPVYCQGYILSYFQDKTTFYNKWPNLTVNQQIGQGRGNVNPTLHYTGIIPSRPFYRAQQDIFSNVTKPAVIISAFDNSGDSISGYNYVITDVPQVNSDSGLLYDSLGNNVGTVNYITGAYDFLPANAATIPTTAKIYVSVVPYQPSRPVDVLFYNNQFTFRPCPLQVYQVEFQISQQPAQLVADNSAPELDEWYLFLCAGAARLVYTDFPDPEGWAYLDPIWQEQLQIAQRRTLRQLGTQRVQTIFSQPGRPYAGFFYGSEYSGTG